MSGRGKFLLRIVNWMLVIALTLSPVPTMAAPGTVSPMQQRSDALRDCSVVPEESLQDELNLVVQEIFATQLVALDLNAIVEQQWTALGMDRILAEAVDSATARVQSETNLWDKFVSAWSPEAARELALAVATYAFDASVFRSGMEALADAVSTVIAGELAVASAESTSVALYCMQTFIDANYSAALAQAFERRVESAVTAAQMIETDAMSPDLLALIGEHRWALGGVGVIVAAQLTRKLMVTVAQRISQRVAGQLVGRLLGRIGTGVVPLAGWILGLGMIAYDLYDSRDGALPQIQAALKSPETAASIRREIAATIRPELENEAPALARMVANELFAEWRTVKRTIRQVLELAAENPAFAELLASLQSQEQLSRLVQLVGVVMANGGRTTLDAAVADGSLRRVLDLPEAAVTIVRDVGSLQAALDWYAAVGGRLNEVAALELHKHLTPDQVDRSQIDALLALKDKTAVARLALLPAPQLAELLKLSEANLVALANRLSPDDLAWLAAQMPVLSLEQRNRLVARLLSQPTVIEPLRRLGDLQPLASIGDLNAAITFLVGPRGGLDYAADTGAILMGEISPQLFWAKYGLWPSVGAGLALLLLLVVALRLAWGFGAWLVQPFGYLRRRKA
ncbi:MAG: hypothetical protein NZ553_13290 [Caldilinea sp.]|nr:hypothetical protein [Caldilinea sp.]MDW8441445.1 hypothetical protein [Caldilineaceae bacterium]